jgi:acyl-CoA reductase-like NAD-dependent aldehyde dehydrogenase
MTETGTEKRLMFIAGRWTDAADGATFERVSPVTGEVVAVLSEGAPQDVDAAVAAARAARSTMASVPTVERAALCRAIAERLDARRAELARELSLEQGKPLDEAKDEVRFAAELYRDAGENVRRLETAVLPAVDPNKRVLTIRQPHGVVGIITPWNYPVAIPSEYLSAGLAAGNAIVWKPAPTTSAIAVRLLECLLEAGVPPEGVNLLFGGGEVGSAMVAHPHVQAVGFTGSAAVGQKVAQAAGAKPLLLELGGNGPTIILEDADLDRAIEAAAFGCFANAGQICQSSERILVPERIHDAVVEGLAVQAGAIRLGHSLEEGTTMGPLNNEGVASKTDAHIRDALERGAMVVTGGRRAAGFPTDLYYEPTVIDRVPADSLFNREETFGPVAPVIALTDLDDVIDVANACNLGLCGAVFTRDLAKAWYVAERLECGVVNINETAAYWDGRTPFGGYSGKASGVGRLGGMATIEALTQLKSMVMDVRLTKSP